MVIKLKQSQCMNSEYEAVSWNDDVTLTCAGVALDEHVVPAHEHLQQ